MRDIEMESIDQVRDYTTNDKNKARNGTISVSKKAMEAISFLFPPSSSQ
jgi:hypothetical protein